MQHLEISCAVRRFFKSLGFKGLMRDLTSGPQVHIRLGNWVWSGFESELGFNFVQYFRGCPLPDMVKGRPNILHQRFPKCAPRMSRDPIPVPMESMGTFFVMDTLKSSYF